MKLYMATSTERARLVIAEGSLGYAGRSRAVYDPDELNAAAAACAPGELLRRPRPTGWETFIEMRDRAPIGLTFSRTTETSLLDVGVDPEGGRVHNIAVWGPVLADDIGDFILSIEVPDEVATQSEVFEDPPSGWPFREFWLPPDLANRYRDTLVVFDSNDGEEVRPDLVGR